MNYKERIVATINNEKTDWTPYHFDLTFRIKEKIAKYYNIEIEKVEEFIGNHFLYLSPEPPRDFKRVQNAKISGEHRAGTFSTGTKKISDNISIDEFGVKWDDKASYDTGDWGMVEHPIKNLSLNSYKFPKGSAPGRFDHIEKIIDSNPNRFNVVLMTGLFDVAWHIVSITDMLMSMAIPDRKFANEILDLALDYNIGVIDQIPSSVDGVRFLEDWATQEGLMLSAKTWRELLKPRLTEMYKAVKDKNCVVMAHSDGNTIELYPDLIEMGVDVIDPNQPEVLDLKFIKREFGRDVVLFGGLGCQSTIPLGSPADVLKEAQDTLKLLGDGGKYIFGPSGSIPTEAPIQNVVTLIEFCKNLKEN